MADDRKARLAALAARAGRGKGTDETKDIGSQSENAEKKKINFRNYTPKDESLEDAIGEPVTKKMKQNVTDESSSMITSSADKEVKSELEQALSEAKVDASKVMQDKGSLNIMAAPKKVNWDLKRDISKKLNRLERRTQKSVVELLRLRLEQEADEENDANDLD